MAENIITVLLVEDNFISAQVIQKLLAESQSPVFKVIPVETLSDAIECLSAGGIDLVLLDLMLPDSQALDTFFRIKAHAVDVPIVVQSGLADVTLAAKPVQGGAQDFLVKDRITGTTLLRSIRYSLERMRARSCRRRAPATIESRPMVVSTIDPSHNKIWRRVIQLLWEAKGKRYRFVMSIFACIATRNAPTMIEARPMAVSTIDPSHNRIWHRVIQLLWEARPRGD